jgi:hypothetical protein
MDPRHFGKPYPDLHQSKKLVLDPDPLQSQNQNSEAVEVQNGAMKGM